MILVSFRKSTSNHQHSVVEFDHALRDEGKTGAYQSVMGRYRVEENYGRRGIFGLYGEGNKAAKGPTI